MTKKGNGSTSDQDSDLHREDGVKVVRGESARALSEVEAEARLHQEGYESFRWHDVPGVTYPRHRHAQDECLWVLDGILEIELTHPPVQKISLKPGDRIYIPAKAPHRAQIPSDDSNRQGVTYLVGQKNKP
jgi:quercetin dioxygenase-like cupin family protein